jgi:hypothetical protein
LLDDMHVMIWSESGKSFAKGMNRPGFDGGSAYWVPTPVGEACWAA